MGITLGSENISGYKFYSMILKKLIMNMTNPKTGIFMNDDLVISEA